jgi:hypothetical protein
MDDFLRWLAQWRGIEVEPGAELQFEFASFPTGGLGLLVLLGMAAAVVVIGFLYRRDGTNLQAWQRLLLGSLRALAVLAVILLLLEPNIVSVKREVREGHTILLVDTSQSMTHLDAWRRDEVQRSKAGWTEVGVDDPATVTRLDLVKALLAADEQAVVQKLAAKNRVQLYGFDGSIRELPIVPPPPQKLGPDGQPLPVDPDAPEPTPVLDLDKLVADGRSSNLGGALRTALDKSRPAEIAAVVFVTDGRRTAGPQGAEIARLLEQRKVPHTYLLGVGDPSETQTVTLTRMEAPSKVFQRDPYEMSATVTSQGYDGVAVTARLVRVDEQGAEVVVGTQQVQIGERQQATIEWKDLTSDAPGRFVYRTEIAPPDGEPVVAERHTKTAAVEVLGERLRMLLLAGGSSHEFQILRNLLIRDKTIDVSCWLQSADEEFPQEGDEDVRITRLPEERVEFDPYDVVVMIDPDPQKLTRRFCENLGKHVTEGGCGLWWVAGEQHTLDALRPAANTQPVADLLPILPDVEFAERKMLGLGKAFPRPWRYRLTPDGTDGVGAKVMRLDDDKDTSNLLWERIPGFHFWFPVAGLKPIATSLAGHPSPEFRVGGEDMPVIALQKLGAGRVLFLGTDETYRWRSLYEDAYNRFWVNGIRYLFEGRLQAGNSRLRLMSSDDKIDLGDAVELVAEAKDEALQPLIVESFVVSVEREGEASEAVDLAPVEALPGTYSLRYRPTQLGTYRVRPVEKAGKAVEISFQVVPAQIESQGPMERSELAAVAAVNGGVLFDTPLELLRALDDVPSRSATDTFRTPHAIWDGWPTITFVLVLLSIEWMLRKRFNLL